MYVELVRVYGHTKCRDILMTDEKPLGLYTKTLTGFEQSMGSLRDVYSFHPSNLYRRYLINHVSVAFPSSKGKDGVN